ncbi:hypothetical protein JX265_008238 [Neoarthrinium moseri]|uniref:Uncharacterized protein n=1 Tax=Neoarthrinium moseri TaxID=1658444 RepID=A0A9Q0ANS0_9PEZI|nr:uncharacterized protein JN550_004937 [Neoarthrinium moseri]KAI1851956.1 hypothetical protein JX266_002809 [Neoarthrinium moseri]KAI1865191.1 hypothetical protein JX265_008238 [Neoarthrinium moseri]KAI1870791.1 hypothetical protein JN550_004937 [Neoarthrinium moseri]
MASQSPRPPRGSRPRGSPAAAAAARAPLATPPKSGSTLKRVIWTGAFAAVTIVGALYGAGLKTQQEYKAERQQIVEATPEQRIKDLEKRRGALMAQKIPLDRKLHDLQARMRAKEAEEQLKATASSDNKPK